MLEKADAVFVRADADTDMSEAVCGDGPEHYDSAGGRHHSGMVHYKVKLSLLDGAIVMIVEKRDSSLRAGWLRLRDLFYLLPVLAHQVNAQLCGDRLTCPSSCLSDQQEWCRKQELFMSESNVKLRDKLIWDFILSFQDLMRNMIKKRKGRNIEIEEAMAHMNLLLYRRFKKAADRGTYYKRVMLKGYINACLGGEIIRIAKANGTDDSLDFILESMKLDESKDLP